MILDAIKPREITEKMDIISGVMALPCSRCGYWCVVGKDKYYFYAYNKKELVVCEKCIHEIHEEETKDSAN